MRWPALCGAAWLCLSSAWAQAPDAGASPAGLSAEELELLQHLELLEHLEEAKDLELLEALSEKSR